MMVLNKNMKKGSAFMISIKFYILMLEAIILFISNLLKVKDIYIFLNVFTLNIRFISK